MYKLFIVEDDDKISKAICAGLNTWGYDARPALDFRNILQEFISLNPHLVLMDINLPYRVGYHW